MRDKEMTEEEAVLVVAKWDYDSKQDEELSIKRNEKLKLIDDSRSWWKVEKQNGRCGYVPSNYVKRDKLGLVERIRKGISAKRGGKPVTRPISPRNSESPHPHTAQPGNEMPFSQPARVMYHYKAAQEDELNLNKGEQVNVLEKSGDGWWRGECNGEKGWFPSNYVSEDDTSMPNSHGSSTSSKGDDNSIPDDFVLGVTTLYAFKGRTDEELNFDASELLDIISNPSDDQDWWKARNKLGTVGLVPSNYVKVVENADPVCPTKFFIEDAVPPKPIEMHDEDNSFTPSSSVGFYDRDWFHGRITRQDSEKILGCPGESGLFLIRESETMPGDFAVSVKAPERVKHFKVTRSDKKFCIGQRKFESLDDLVDHYKRSPIFSSDDGELKLYLTRPNQRN
ncbi:cytoplasmic protein NCK2 isoform X2 [Strongylocentrotus purpuratus]|uniref:Cytoplasmic protein NCK2 n=1 Tax=Strongylocentrotus purpuratus TaxID=7668 RepID=A0A7M7RDB7_STRPU|nr:cytoplasmic protein NCK2 isoform X2 [Strongylocentrotus purpuratus]|eukprot:XP_784072.2 PREDICTED: cytoplasmic protein NCK2 isoform X3 [Strongylocentrotus purpuratus]